MNRRRNLLLAALLAVFAAACCRASDIYIAQNATGANNGADCGDAYGLTFFNDSSNWGSTSGKVGPGTTIHLCGTFSASAGSSEYFTFQGSGTSGSPITLIADQGTISVTAAYWSGKVIDVGSNSYITVNGANNLTIQAAANGTQLANHQGGGVYNAFLDNCTVQNNSATSPSSGAGIYDNSYLYTVRNCIVVYNYSPSGTFDNYFPQGGSGPTFSYSCTSPTPSGTGNLNVNPQLLDAYHLSSTSPCIGAGSAAYATGSDLDGEPWNNPPAMGCSELILSNLVGALSVNILSPMTNILVNRNAAFFGRYTGNASSETWTYSDGVSITNSPSTGRVWNNVGDYSVTFTVYNNDNPAGVSTNIAFQVLPVLPAQLQPSGIVSNAFQFQFSAQVSATYTIQYTTNLTPPAVWQTLQSIYYSFTNTVQVSDPSWTNAARFYRVKAQ